MQRIRYVEYKPGVLASRDEYTNARGTIYRAFILVDELRYYIRNEKTNHKHFNPKHKNKNIRALKRNVRRMLQKLGVAIEYEMRGSNEA